MILIIDNYDSFVFNIARYLHLLGCETNVVRNDAVTLSAIRQMDPHALVLSPGPRAPADAGITLAAIREFSGAIPLLGICLGHQAIGEAFGGRTKRALQPMHGLASELQHDGTGLFAGLQNPMMIGRYHSLVVDLADAPALAIDGWSREGEIMALSHRTHPTFGVQFHPESVLTTDGQALFANFLKIATEQKQPSRRQARA